MRQSKVLEKFMPWHRQDVSANPRAHVVRATQPGCRCQVARGAWSCVGDTEELCLLSYLIFFLLVQWLVPCLIYCTLFKPSSKYRIINSFLNT
uniref:Uncharacterized protein n=1 Tax=Chrysemys picta bellii TaxID=8478 RepID=A0A8C3F614_CHRPI